MIVHNEVPVSPATVAGAWSGNTEDIKGGKTGLLYVAPTTSSTQYNLTVTGPDNEVIVSETALVGTHCDCTPIAVRGIYTIAISGASVDEAFVIKWSVVE